MTSARPTCLRASFNAPSGFTASNCCMPSASASRACVGKKIKKGGREEDRRGGCG
ncbi:MAG: hypothetical protein MJE68_00435 [Proteobacteria bacterium]|nr:hypothetical protein [Pseudomonadota bacterium]